MTNAIFTKISRSKVMGLVNVFQVKQNLRVMVLFQFFLSSLLFGTEGRSISDNQIISVKNHVVDWKPLWKKAQNIASFDVNDREKIKDLLDSLSTVVRDLTSMESAIKRHQDMIEHGPLAIAELKGKIELRHQQDREILISKEMGIEEVQQNLILARNNLNASQKGIDALDAEIAAFAQKNHQLQDRLSDLSALPAKTMKLNVDTTIPSVYLEDMLEDFKILSLQKEQQKIELELSAYKYTAQLAPLERQWLQLQVLDQKESVKKWEERLKVLREQDAARAQLEALELKKETIGKHQVIQRQVEEISEVALRLEEMGKTLNRVQGELEHSTLLLDQMYATEKDIQEILDLHLGDASGSLLLAKRMELQEIVGHKARFASRNKEMAKLKLNLFKTDREVRSMGNMEKKLMDLLEAYPINEELSVEEREGLKSELRLLLKTKMDQLQKFIQVERETLDGLSRLEIAEQTLIKLRLKITKQLENELLWTKDASPITDWYWNDIEYCLKILVDFHPWQDIVVILYHELRDSPLKSILYFLFCLFLATMRPKMLRLIALKSKSVGRVHLDHFYITAQVVLLQILRSAPIPLLIYGIAKMMDLRSDEQMAVVIALKVLAIEWFTVKFMIGICRPFGLCRVHFKWEESSTELIRKNMFWAQWSVIPISVIMVYFQNHPDFVVRDIVGRVSFLLCLIPIGGLILNLKFNDELLFFPMPLKRGLGRTPFVIIVIAILMSFFIMLVSGYTYAAKVLSICWLESFLLWWGVVFLYSLMLRWLLIVQRKFSYRLAIEKRDLKLREIKDSDDGYEERMDILEEIDVSQVKTQSIQLLRMGADMLFVVGTAFIWFQIFPAISMLDSVVLWHQTIQVGSELVSHGITLSNLLMGAIVFFSTVFASRNMPGFLEVVLLERLQIDIGTRYALKTLLLYSIWTIGVILSFNFIGIGWESIQWLVAALTVGLGFGLQEIFANFVSGLIILVERPIRLGDTITVGNVSGVVSRIRIRATTITDWSMKELIVPNKSFITGELVNWSLSDPILRLNFPVGIAYGSDTAVAQQLMLKVCHDHPAVLEHPGPDVFFTSFGDNSLNFDIKFSVKETTNRGRNQVIHDLHMAVEKVCRENGIEISYPQRDLHLKSSDITLKIKHVADEEKP